MRRKLHVRHVAYAGLGGHAGMFFGIRDASPEWIEHSVVFYGVEPIEPAYRERCDRDGVSYSWVEKRVGVDPAYYLRLFEQMVAGDVDVIFLHSSGQILPAAMAAALRGKRVVVRETQANHLKTKADWLFLGLALSAADHCVLLSDAYYSELKQTLGWLLRDDAVSVIPNGLDLDVFAPSARRAGSDDNAIRIGMQSRLVSIKDHLALVRATRRVVDQLPGRDIKTVIAGDGETRSEIEALVRDLGLDEHVVMAGMLNQERLLDLLRSLDIYVHSTFGETMSNAIMQAQAVGLPVVATDVSGVNNVIRHRENGLLFALHDDRALAQHIIDLIENPSERLRLALSSRAYAEEHLCSKKMIAAYLEILAG